MTQQAAALPQPDLVGPLATTVILVAGGFIIVPLVAKVAPTLVNGFLILVLFGLILFNSDRWMKYLPGATLAAGAGAGSTGTIPTGSTGNVQGTGTLTGSLARPSNPSSPTGAGR